MWLMVARVPECGEGVFFRGCRLQNFYLFHSGTF